MNILILGAGYIGNHLYEHIQKDIGCEAKTNVHLKSRSQLDYSRRQILTEYIAQHKIQLVIGATGYPGRHNVDACETDKQRCWFHNVKIPLTIESACVTTSTSTGNHPPPRFIHISSGCIYDGYESNWTEQDEPNFGLYNNSSWYSKTKHAAETLLDLRRTIVLRISMPFSSCSSSRNYIQKMLMYDNLISRLNSMTCVEDLCEFITTHICRSEIKDQQLLPGIYNVVHCQPTSARNIVSKLEFYTDKQFNFTNIEDLNLAAPRSNCTLSTSKISSYNLQLPDINDSLDKCIEKIFSTQR